MNETTSDAKKTDPHEGEQHRPASEAPPTMYTRYVGKRVVVQLMLPYLATSTDGEAVGIGKNEKGEFIPLPSLSGTVVGEYPEGIVVEYRDLNGGSFLAVTCIPRSVIAYVTAFEKTAPKSILLAL